MDHSKKLAFITQMTAQALDHVARTPNIAAPDGKMSHDKKLAFVNQMAKAGLQHFDSGGAVQPLTTVGPGDQSKTQADQNNVLNPTKSIPALLNPADSIHNTFAYAGDIAKDAAASLTTQNQFQATAAPITAGTNAGQLNQAYTGVQGGLAQQQGLADTLTPGVSQGANAQNALSNQLLAQANGQGPNPAQAQFKQNSQALAGQQAGAIASQKGISPALAARMIAQQGGAAQQNAAGQGATLAAQQQIAAQQNLQNLSANQVAQGTTAVQGVNNAQQNEQNILQSANTAYNNAQVSQQSNLNSVNAGVASQNADAVNKTQSGLFGGLSAVASLFAKGGEVKKYADGGVTGEDTDGPTSYAGQWLDSNESTAGPQVSAAPAPSQGVGGVSSPLPGGGGDSGGGGGGLGSLFSAAEARGGLMENGGAVKAGSKKEKAGVAGDSYSNDKIPAMLSEGELVIDRDTMQDKGPMGQMARALAAHIKGNKK